MNENQMLRKIHDRHTSLRNYDGVGNPNSMSPIEKEAHRVEIATNKEDMTIGPADRHPNTVVYGD